jgi:hypothetical protein
MAVEEVHQRGKVGSNNPRSPREPESAWAKRTQELRDKNDYLEEKKMQEQIVNPPPPQETPFKVHGSVNLGDVDIQEQSRQQQEDAKAEREAAQGRLETLNQKNDDLKEKLHQSEVQGVVGALKIELDSMKQSIIAGAKAPDLTQEIQKIQALAGALGLEKPQSQPTDSQLQIELKRLDMETADKDRLWEQEKIKSERMWQLEQQKIQGLIQGNQNQILIEQQKVQALISIPEKLGGVIGKAIVDGTKKGGTGSGSGNVSRRPSSPRIGKLRELTAAAGEEGEVSCPECDTPMYIAPTARTAECASCHTRISVKRGQAQQQQQPSPEPEPEPAPDILEPVGAEEEE